MKKIILLLIIQILAFATPVYATEYTYTDDYAKIKFNVDEAIWTETNLTEERDSISNKWEKDCGILMYGSTDFYGSLSSSEKGGLTRKEFNDSLIDSTFASDYVEGFSSNGAFSIDDWLIQDYNLKFIDMYGNANYYGTTTGVDVFSTLNNGYLVMFQYYGDGCDECISQVEKIVKSTKSTQTVSNYQSTTSSKENTSSNSDNFWGELIISLILTIFFYMFFPVVRLIINKGKFNEEKAKKIALWNSIIVGGIFMIITIDNGGQWQAAPAIFYYYINKSILTDKNVPDNNQLENDLSNQDCSSTVENEIIKK